MNTGTNNMRLLRMVLEPKPGSDISDCRIDACILAMQKRTDVTFKHNGTEYSATFEDILNQCCSENEL